MTNHLFGSDIDSPVESGQGEIFENNNTLLPLPPPPAAPAASQPEVSAKLLPDLEDGAVPQFTNVQKKELWKILQSTSVSSSQAFQTADIQELMRHFLQDHGTSLFNQISPPEHNMVLGTQCESKTNPPPLGARISHRRDKNSENRIGQYKWYDTFPIRANWAATENGVSVAIDYTNDGELAPSVKFDRSSLVAYIRGCARNRIRLRLWIQYPAPMHTDRFPSHASLKCRAANCPSAHNKIGRGNFQVSFDEYPTETSNGRLDPFYVAGYMHLFCLEDMIPLAELMEFADVQPDIRELPLEEKNPMSLKRDRHTQLLDVYHAWKAKHYTKFMIKGLPIPKAYRPNSERLYNCLTMKKIAEQPKTRQRMWERRKGVDITKYCGDLRMRQALKEDVINRRKRTRDDQESTGNSSEDASPSAASDRNTTSNAARAITAPPTKRPRKGSSKSIKRLPVGRKRWRSPDAQKARQITVPQPSENSDLPSHPNDSATALLGTASPHDLGLPVVPAALPDIVFSNVDLSDINLSQFDLDVAMATFVNASETETHDQQLEEPPGPSSPDHLIDPVLLHLSEPCMLGIPLAERLDSLPQTAKTPTARDNKAATASTQILSKSQPASRDDPADLGLSTDRRATRSIAHTDPKGAPEAVQNAATEHATAQGNAQAVNLFDDLALDQADLDFALELFTFPDMGCYAAT